MMPLALLSLSLTQNHFVYSFDHIFWISRAKSSHGAPLPIDTPTDHPIQLERKFFFNLRKLWLKITPTYSEVT